MKSLNLFAFIIAAAVLPLSAQDKDKNTFTVTAAAVRRNVDLRLPNGNDLQYRPDSDSVGFEVQYVRKVAGPLGIGIEGGASFHDQDISGVVSCGSGCSISRNGTSKVALGWANYLVQLQARKGPIQPYAQATIGLHRSGFGGVSFAGGHAVSSGGSRFTWGGGGGVDIRLTKKTFLRAGIGLTKAFHKRNSDQWDAKLVLGISKRW